MIKTFCPQALKCTKNDTCEHGVNKQEKDRLFKLMEEVPSIIVQKVMRLKIETDEAFFLVGKQPCFERKK